MAANAHASLRLVLNYTGVSIVEDARVHLPVTPAMLNEDGIIARRRRPRHRRCFP
jgi:hypothetical protein